MARNMPARVAAEWLEGETRSPRAGNSSARGRRSRRCARSVAAAIGVRPLGAALFAVIAGAIAGMPACAGAAAEQAGEIERLEIRQSLLGWELRIPYEGPWSTCVLSDPPRLVVDLSGARSRLPGAPGLYSVDLPCGPVTALRTSQFSNETGDRRVRVTLVLDEMRDFEASSASDGVSICLAGACSEGAADREWTRTIAVDAPEEPLAPARANPPMASHIGPAVVTPGGLFEASNAGPPAGMDSRPPVASNAGPPAMVNAGASVARTIVVEQPETLAGCAQPARNAAARGAPVSPLLDGDPASLPALPGGPVCAAIAHRPAPAMTVASGPQSGAEAQAAACAPGPALPPRAQPPLPAVSVARAPSADPAERAESAAHAPSPPRVERAEPAEHAQSAPAAEDAESARQAERAPTRAPRAPAPAREATTAPPPASPRAPAPSREKPPVHASLEDEDSFAEESPEDSLFTSGQPGIRPAWVRAAARLVEEAQKRFLAGDTARALESLRTAERLYPGVDPTRQGTRFHALLLRSAGRAGEAAAVADPTIAGPWRFLEEAPLRALFAEACRRDSLALAADALAYWRETGSAAADWPPAALQYVDLALAHGDAGSARLWLDRALAARAELAGKPAVMVLRAAVCLAEGSWQEADRALEGAARRAEGAERCRVLAMRADLRFRRGAYAEAREFYGELLGDGIPAVEREWAAYQMGNCWAAEANAPEARRWFEEIAASGSFWAAQARLRLAAMREDGNGRAWH